MGDEDIQSFLAECKESGDKAYGALKSVLTKLDNVDSRAEARRFLDRVETYVITEEPDTDTISTYHFRIHELSLCGQNGYSENGQKIKLLELPSIFIPEDWSFTFFEGLNRHPESGFQDRDVVELGCGNGWISLALAQRWSPRKIYGLDINPRAIKVAWINLYLNALNGDGSPILDHEGKTLIDRVEFYESDLLAWCKDRNILLDRIVGCIPQVLNPDPEAMLKMVSENASEDFLYSLSNYCGLQGFVEDQFGLGLVARAAEEGIALLRPNGAMIFNIGGRPGQAVSERLFERRGFHINKLWQTRVNQAADTDILALVEIEKNSRHHFEFYMGRVCDEPISARTAYTYAKAGGKIAHGLSVYECRLRQPKQVKTIFNFLSEGFEKTRGALDLSFKEEAVADEKIAFLAHLAQTLTGMPYFPLELPTGSPVFRGLISSFLRNYHRVPLTPESVAVLPSRSIVIENIIRLFAPKLALVDANLTRSLPKKWITSMPSFEDSAEANGNHTAVDDSITVIEAPQRTDLVTQLVKFLKPQVVVTTLASFEMQTSTAFEQLLDITEKVSARLFLDISDHLELSSLPGTNGVLQYMASHSLPLHATIICGLVKNQVYSDLEVSFVISENQDLLNALAKTSELTCGQTAYTSQFYYGVLLHELLNFQLSDRHNHLQRLPKKEQDGSSFIGFAENANIAIGETEMSSCQPQSVEVVDLRREENALLCPLVVKVAVFEGYARQNIAEFEMDPKPEILKLVRTLCGISSKDLVLSSSSVALFTKLVSACVEEGGTLCIPRGSNGTFVSAAKLLKANIKELVTNISNDFKLTGKIVDEVLEKVDKPWLYISGPTIAPTGLVYSHDEIISILGACKKHGARVIIDSSYSWLDYEEPCVWNLEDVFGKDTSSCDVAILGGTSQLLLTGGVECAFAALNGPLFIEAFKDSPNMSKPHGTLRYSVKKLLQMLEEKSSDLLDGFSSHKNTLRHRAELLQKVLLECGWEVIMPSSGISMVASPASYYGKDISHEASGAVEKIKLDNKNFTDVLVETTGLHVSSSAWTGIPDYVRFVISVKEEDFQKALRCIKSFSQACN
ncbi:hypothetical protein MPTK1_8g11490 [Marchantia polymorpha subsp. ruderalis]|uniref:Methionine S-methyltransferase n=1 Tax=Marchantia polymorpha TaxID=3197 RepID=A0A2R6XMG7_MARPO|nr:hypothetical protein MARPO_0008s0067 [Marchantia polymorpha]BBN19534.1 hypothetical protein Mp_8g11490 [Marchantia polymorpha subsp. ruderalis]|eukprot:PTQ47290.1 hypothetical protein MARPO_0008s0067 [Marchantia polymorpha]